MELNCALNYVQPGMIQQIFWFNRPIITEIFADIIAGVIPKSTIDLLHKQSNGDLGFVF